MESTLDLQLTLRLPTPPMETPDPPSDTPGASKQVVLTPHDIPRSLRVEYLEDHPRTDGYVVNGPMVIVNKSPKDRCWQRGIFFFSVA